MIKTKAAIQLSINQELIIDDLKVPEPQSEQVIVKLISSGICHTQLNQLNHPDLKRPLLFGHEGLGIVTHLGNKVKNVKEGNHVIITWIPQSPIKDSFVPISSCLTYRGGAVHGTLCTWADHILTNAEYVVSISKEYSDEVSCIVGCPVPSGAGAVLNTAKVQPGDSVAVYGAGGVGLSAICMASIIKAYPVIAVDIRDDKLCLAKEFGATHIVNASKQDPVESIKDITNGGVDFAFDATGTRITAEQILPSTRGGGVGVDNDGGVSILIGTAGREITLDPRLIISPQRLYRGSLGAANPKKDFVRFLRWYKEGKFPLDRMVTRRYKLDQINKACDELRNGSILGRAIIVY